MSKHTPGPWRVGTPGYLGLTNPYLVHAHLERGKIEQASICTVYGISLHTNLEDLGDRDREGLANAHLIAAAPSLLSALEAVEWSRVVDMHGGQHDAYQCPTCWGDKHDGHTDCSLHAALKLARGESPTESALDDLKAREDHKATMREVHDRR